MAHAGASYCNNTSSRLTLQPGLWFSFIIRILRKSPNQLRRTQSRSPASFLTRAITCGSRVIRTDSLLRMRQASMERDLKDHHSHIPLASSLASQPETASGQQQQQQQQTTPLRPNYSARLCRSPSLSGVVGDAIVKIRHTATEIASSAPAVAANSSRCVRQLWRRVQITTGINLRTAEDIAAVVNEQLRERNGDDQRHSNAASLPCSQKQLEDLFLRYLRLSAPDSGVALSFLHAMDPAADCK